MKLTKSNINPALKPAWDNAGKALKDKPLKGTWGTVYWQSLPHGRGAGVSIYTMFRILAAFEKGAQNKLPVANALVLRQHSEVLKYCVECFKWGIDRLGLTDLYEIHVHSRKIVRKGTNATIFFKSADEIENLSDHRFPKVASNIQQIWFEEADEFQKKTVARVCYFNTQDIRSKGHNAIAYLTFNPKSASHWTSKLKHKKPILDVIKEYPSNFTTMPRRWLGEDFFKMAAALKSSNPKMYRHEFLGEVLKKK